MKILVLSDSHGNSYNIKRAINMHPNCDAVIFLGDGLGDFYSVSSDKHAALTVRGNCDWEPIFSHIPKVDSITLENKKIVFTHGQEYGVKFGLDGLRKLASDTSADIILFGHTHEPLEYYENGVYYFNPGTASGAYTGKCTFGIITIHNNGILLSHGKLEKI